MTDRRTDAERNEAAELAWETAGTRVDYACPGFDVRVDDVRFPDGTADEYHYVDEPPAVVILPFTSAGDVVVIDEWRQAVDRVNRGLPAGTVEPEDAAGSETAPARESGTTAGRDFETAAARELAEETGYAARGGFEHLITVEPTNGIANSVHHHFLAHDCEPTAERDLDHNESIDVDVVDYEDLLAAVVDGACRDGRTVTAVLQYELTRR
ncbi:NUDIX hydrolase [Halopenitus persicus]|uniref:ADP-ribose pyrophosphatase n=1 Tax=Halopenitus persicus TaxID=1048396 RepID=A0A1H3M0W1_9EURY|nr:NUDIX hydrolase [Halopenitus persicus]QHS18166.1 NUDIX hydrolase [haloarchaeon 3A1-DGR]SDY69685.1 ADP-ribose pyrophosphatase [Halopenitus persicus]